MKKGLDAISARTEKLWIEVANKFGPHEYTLGVNGLDEVVLSRRYMDDIAKGNREVQKVLRELLNA